MRRGTRFDRRAVSSVLAVLLLVAVVIVLATTTSGYVLDRDTEVPPPAPQISVSHDTVSVGGDDLVAVTLDGGDVVRIDRLYLVGSKPLDVGGAPGGGTLATEADASRRERLAEAQGGGPPQVGIGETWDAGETISLDPVGDADGVTVRVYWSTRPIEDGTITDDHAYEIVEFTV
jgi:flagellin-like protein